MATKKGVWNLQQVRDKQLQSLWDYAGMSNLFLWGHNDNGNLGQGSSPGTLDSASSPVQVPGSWAAHYKGNMTNFATRTDGTAWVWGANGNGIFGTNQTSGESYSPLQIGTDTTWSTAQGRYLAMNNQGCSAIKADGTLWWWGASTHGFDGTSNGSDTEAYRRSSPVQVGSDTTWARMASGYTTGANAAIKTDGTLWSWGYNQRGSTGLNDRVNYSSPVQLPGTTWSTDPQKFDFTGKGSTLGIKTDGTLWAWGRNDNGSLGQNNVTQYSSPVQVPGTSWSYCQCFDYSNGQGGMLATRTDKTLWMWGRNNYGELGQNNRTDYSSPVQIPGTDWSGETLTPGHRFVSCIQAD